MASLLEVAITFIGVMLVLALAAQSLQEVVKIVFAVKGQARRRALEGLIGEATRAVDLLPADGEKLLADVVERIRGLGQNGVRPSAIRLDSLTSGELSDLIRTAATDTLPSLKALGAAAAKQRLGEIAQRAESWFGIAMGPVEDRYGRRMRGLAVACAAVVVIGLNVDARYVFQQARLDPVYQATVGASLPGMQAIVQRQKARQDSIAAHPDTTDSAVARLRREERADRDSVVATLRRLQTGGFTLGSPAPRAWGSLGWWGGILISVLLVSLGAPFWNDLLGTVFGLKARLLTPAAPSAGGGATAPPAAPGTSVSPPAAPPTPPPAAMPVPPATPPSALAPAPAVGGTPIPSAGPPPGAPAGPTPPAQPT